MRGSAWFWGVAALVLVGAALLVMPEARVDVALAAAAATATLVSCAALTLVTAARYRDTRDTHDLFVSVGFGAIALQTAIFGLWITLRDGTTFAITTGTADYTVYPAGLSTFNAETALCWLFGLLVAAGCFLIALPWWDRRGRPPVRAWRVIALVAIVLAAGSIAIVLTTDSLISSTDLAALRVPEALGELGWFLSVACAAVLLVAAFREVKPSESGVRRRWLALAFAILVPAALGQLVRPTVGSSWVRWADLLPTLAATLGVLGILAEQRRASTRMRRASDLAEEIMAGRAEIASMIAHEVRGPASAIKGLATTIRKSYERLSDEDRIEFVGLIQAESQLLLDTVDQTALALRVDAGTLAVDRRPQDVATVVREGAEAADARGHELELDLADEITAELDRRWLGEIVRQLVDNAAKFSPADAPIRVSLTTDAGHILIDVNDRGPGIPQDRREPVFERFSRWRPPGYEDLEGSGFGLFICRGLAAEHGGDVSIEGGEDGGTMLRVRLPIDVPERQRGR